MESICIPSIQTAALRIIRLESKKSLFYIFDSANLLIVVFTKYFSTKSKSLVLVCMFAQHTLEFTKFLYHLKIIS